MEHFAKLGKSHGILLLSVMQVYQFCPRIIRSFCNFFVITEEFSIFVEVRIFRCFLQNAANAKSRREMVIEN